MANIPLKTLTFPGLDDTYTIPQVDNTLATAGDAADAKKTGDEINQIKADLADVAWKRLPLEPSWFVGGAYIGTGWDFSDNQYRAGSAIAITHVGTPVYIKSNSESIDFSVYDSTKNEFVSGWATEYKDLEGSEYALTIRVKDSSTSFKTEYLNNVEFYVPSTMYNDVYNDLHVELTTSDLFSPYGNNGIFRYGMNLSGDMVGTLVRNQLYKRSTAKLLWSKTDCTIIVGRLDSTIVTIGINGTYVQVPQGKSYTIPANTLFTLYFSNSTTNYSNTMPTNVYHLLDGVPPRESKAQMVVSVSGTSDTFFMADGKIFLIKQSDNTYAVYDGETLVKSSTALDHAVGHANSCNYVDGKVYISDWDDTTLIHVFDVDTENNTLTYSKDITIPNDKGSCEYYVFDNERQIYGLGWNQGKSDTDPNFLVVSLWIKSGNTYVKSFEKNVIRSDILQSFTVQDGYIYYVLTDLSFKNTNIARVNINTGITEHNRDLSPSSIVSNEGEGIVPLGMGVFLVSTYANKLYLVCFGEDTHS